MRHGFPILMALLLAGCATASAPSPAAKPAPQAELPPQEANGYTRYELLAPDTGKFRIVYDITAIRAGATAFFNPIRKGSTASEESAVDLATGEALPLSVVSGADAAKGGLPDADPTYDYIRVQLARPVPADDGEGRIRILKTYEDRKSYYQDGANIVFDRSLGVKRNAVVLPAGYGLADCNYPVQVEQEADGRLKVSFINDTPADAPLKLVARPMQLSAAPSAMHDRIEERARQTRDIVYTLRDPATHSFELYHDYTEDRPGVGRYVNVVRAGSTVSAPSARDLDTGNLLPWRILRGDAIKAAAIADPDLKTITPDTQVVVFIFEPVKPGHSLRLRMSETYTDPERYKLVGDELVFDRSLGRPANAVVLPSGWKLTNSTVPAQISTTTDGRVRLDFVNSRDDEIQVLITARK